VQAILVLWVEMYLKPYTVCDIVGQLAYPGFFQFVYYFNTQILSSCLNELLLNHATNINDKISSCKPHISNTRILGFFFTTTAEKRTIMPHSPLPKPTHTPHLQHQGPFQNHHTHTHITSPTLGFLGFCTTKKRTPSLPSKKTHTHTHSHLEFA
jgi:hypothetical protein